ncbi:MAG: preprotein translocase subunit SecG [Bacteroidota bacterium]
MYTAVIALIIFIAILLILAVLVQNSKGGGLASQYGGASSSQLMGVKKTGDLLEQITWGLAISLMVLSLSTTLLVSQPAEEGVNKVNIENAPQRQAPAPAQAPANQPAAPQPATDSVNK